MKNIELKRRIVEVSYKLKLSHIGSCLSVVDLIEEIYAKKKPEDKFVLSSGHAHLAHLVVMDSYRKMEVIEPTDIEHLIHIIKDYGIHCDRKAGCDVSTGSLGHGIGIALGMALANPKRNVYCIVSDGETREGSVWEALRIQKEQYVDNLFVYVAINGWGAYHQINGIMLNNQIEYMSWAKPEFTSLLGYPKWLHTQEGHYGVLDKKRYDELIKFLQ